MNKIDVEKLIDLNPVILAKHKAGKNKKQLTAYPGMTSLQVTYCLGGRTIFKPFTSIEEAEEFYNDLEF